MASPAVWADVRSRLEAADLGGVPIAWPNEGFFEPGSTFVSVRIRAAFGVPIELGQSATWQEEGDVFCTVLVPEGTGITAALTVAKAIVEAATNFRDPHILAKVSRGLGDAMPGLEIGKLDTKLADRGW